MAEQETEETEQPIIIKKIKKGGGHHGGAWKVAYADFVTAMMAFFLLLWLLNVTTEDQKNAISNYFDPTHPKVSDERSGAGGVLGGLSMAPKGSMATNVQSITPPKTARVPPRGQTISPENAPKERAKQAKRQKEQERFKKASERLKKTVEESPELSKLTEHLIVDMTPEGLRIQIVDQEDEPMFALGSAQPYEKTRQLLAKITEVVEPLPNEISIRGHTDSVPYGPDASYTNWELSTDRANASRRIMLEAGLDHDRLNNVVGKADTAHLLPDEPENARNRRISIILLKEEITNPDAYENIDTEGFEEGGLPSDAAPVPAPQAPIGTYRKTPGKVEFP